MAHRVERFSSTLKQCIADILMNEMNNPRLKNAVISDVIVSEDLKKARVFISSTSAEDVDEILSGLAKAKGFIKRSVGKRMYLKYVPDLLFIKDETTAWGRNI